MSMIVNVRLLLTEESLGMSSANKNIHRDYVIGKFEKAAQEGKAGHVLVSGRPVPVTPEMAKAAGSEELENLSSDEIDAKGRTVFPRMEVDGDEDVPFFWDYQMKGFFKDSIKALRKAKGTECSKIKAYRQAVDGLMFIFPRQIPIMADDGPAHVSGTCERPLRANTPMGERVALSSSETVPAGSHIDMRVMLMDDSLWPAVSECLQYGCLRGLGQWRNSGKGRFVWKIIDEKAPTGYAKHLKYNDPTE